MGLLSVCLLFVFVFVFSVIPSFYRLRDEPPKSKIKETHQTQHLLRGSPSLKDKLKEWRALQKSGIYDEINGDIIHRNGKLAISSASRSPLIQLQIADYIRRRQAPRIRAAVPVQTPLQDLVSKSRRSIEEKVPYMSHCNVENFTASTRSLRPATSCSILVSVSFMRISWLFASSRIRPFSRLRSSRTDAWVRPISSRSRELSFARSAPIFSCDERVSWASVESAFNNSERSFAKSTFCV